MSSMVESAAEAFDIADRTAAAFIGDPSATRDDHRLLETLLRAEGLRGMLEIWSLAGGRPARIAHIYSALRAAQTHAPALAEVLGIPAEQVSGVALSGLEALLVAADVEEAAKLAASIVPPGA